MGHERVGALPHTKRWRDVVGQLAESSGSPEDVAAIANDTLENVRCSTQEDSFRRRGSCCLPVSGGTYQECILGRSWGGPLSHPGSILKGVLPP